MTDVLPHEADELRSLMERSLHDVQPAADLLEPARTRGRRLRRRRRAAGGALGLAAAAAVTAVWLPATSGDDSPGIATDPPSPSSTGWWDSPADAMLIRLRSLLPDSVRVADVQLAPPDRAPGEPDVSQGWVRVVLKPSPDARGGLEVMLYPPTAFPTPGPGEPALEPSLRDRITCPGDLRSPDTCQELRDERGRIYGRIVENRTGELVYREAAIAVDGGLVYVAEANSTAEKWGPGTPVSADLPPLTMADLQAVAVGGWERG